MDICAGGWEKHLPRGPPTERCFFSSRTSKKLLKDEVYQKNIADSASCDGKEHLPFPQMKDNYQKYGDQLRKAVASVEDAYIFQTVNDKESKYCGREYIAKISHEWRHVLSPGKKKKWEKTCCHSRQNDHGNCQQLLYQCHYSSPPFVSELLLFFREIYFVSSGRRTSVRMTRIAIMDGMMKFSAPNITRQRKERQSPRTELV